MIVETQCNLIEKIVYIIISIGRRADNDKEQYC